MTRPGNFTPNILVVDDDRAFRLSTAALLETDGFSVHTVGTGQQALEAVRERHYDAMLLDVKMPGIDGISVVEALRLWGNGTPVLMISGVGTVSDAVRALQVGADDFLTKPVEPELLAARITALLERRPNALDEAARAPRGGMVGRSAEILAVFAEIRKVAPTESTVLITGETGTGKELAAKAVHQQSARSTGPFVTIDCGALSDTLLESELFGHVRGAFTGALRDKVGLFEGASGGTIFLDEIGGISVALQQRLLRVVQEREATRVGALRATSVDVRVIAATNRDLRAEVTAGRFREDLFYRLNVFPVALPALRDRRSDIPLLFEFALDRLARRASPGRIAGATVTCTPFATRLLRAFDWPGNVRQLFAVAESAFIHAVGQRVGAQHLPAEVRGVWDATEENSTLARYHLASAEEEEREAIVDALAQTGGALARTAELLGMGRTTLWRKIKAHRISVGDDGPPQRD